MEQHQVVAFPVGLDKKPGIRRWQTLTREEALSTQVLQRYSDSHPSIGVLLGPVSGDLVSIDCDSDEFLEKVLIANPKLHETLITQAFRGGNIWLRMEGPYPPLTRLRRGRMNCGEWRSTGGFTIIAGRHARGMEYQSNAMPIRTCTFASLKWPDGVTLRKSSNEDPGYSFLPSAPLQSCTSASTSLEVGESTETIELSSDSQADALAELNYSVIDPELVLRHLGCKKTAETELQARDAHLARLYREFVETRFPAAPNARNQVVVEAVTFLYRAVGTRFVVPLVQHFYERHRPLFHDSAEQHRREAEAMLKGTMERFQASLPEAEKQIYQGINPRQQDAFRICRDLASLSLEQDRGPRFFMSCDQLGLRLGIRPQSAWNLLRELVAFPVLKQIGTGTRREAGKPGRAAEFQWLLPLLRQFPMTANCSKSGTPDPSSRQP